ncbi:MAG: HEAT repeat domain-containing protein [Ktedonobacteraceae bacterium]
MEHYNGKQHRPANADHHLSTQGDAHAPATLLPAVLSRLGLNNGQAEHPATTQNALIDLHNSDWHVRVAAVRMLGKQGKQAPIEHLLAALQDEDGSVRAATVYALATLEEYAPIEQLIAALHDPDWHVRETAVLALGKLRQPLPDDVFNAALHDQDSAVREAAQLATRWTRQGVLHELQTPPTVATPAPIFPAAQNHLSAKNTYVKQITSGNASGDNMREQRPRQSMSEQQAEYGYYGYQEGRASSQWEKVTSYTPRKNYHPLWIGGSVGIVLFLIAAAGFLTFFVQRSSATSQIEFIKPMGMPMPIATPELQQQAIYVYQNHHDIVNAVAWSPDSTRIASASDDKTVQVWDALTGSKPFVFGGHTAQVDTVAWSPNGQLIASGSVDGIIEIWDPNNGHIDLTYNFAAVADSQHIGALQAFSGGDDPGTYTLMWSADGSRIAAAMGSSVVKVFDARTGNTLYTYRGFASKIDAMAWSPDGKYIVTAGRHNATTVWNAANGNTIFTSPVSDGNAVFSLAWAPDSQRVALGYLDGSVRVWNPFIDSFLALNGHAQYVYALAWSPDGSRLATASIDNTVQVVDATTGMQILVYIGRANELRTMAWAPNGSFIASGFSDDTVQVWKAP